MNTESTSRTEQLVAGLRELADWYEAHPDAPLPKYPSWTHCVLADNDGDGQREVALVAYALGVTAEFSRGSADARRQFGAVEFKAFYVSRRRAEDHRDDMQFLAERGRS